MITIHKFILPSIGGKDVKMPRHARILSVQNQLEMVTLWASVDTDNPPEVRRFEVALTGAPLAPLAPTNPFIGTVQLNGGAYVAHVFEVRP